MRVERLCPLCGKIVAERTKGKCPNLKRHIIACEAKRNRKKITLDERNRRISEGLRLSWARRKKQASAMNTPLS